MKETAIKRCWYWWISDRISNETKDFEPNSHHIDYKRRYEYHAGLTASATEWLIDPRGKADWD
ncbi:hypothetical protein [Bacillus atrophaeus]|uniref:hypothetical protein n=1 Tax=Bacillus atrophaeus TaxID=1452 RepID=UPI00227E89CF|nr:hypothetical protein [Bacillus atrophaeus]MCY9160999.1 hypothetical protein [Bacillus atrophaeus]MEC0765637.1 hypothetical protein [Bacillus atrophaeus]MEC0777692.1 hypothetical protein [Bacillus atrophaeus]MEC0807727.1 hypothetical protein [Bacillus atrophaeus]